MIPSYPKIHHIGSLYIPDLFKGEIEITEKVDGSFFAFGVEDGNLVMRSKGCELFRDSHDKNFGPAVATVLALEDYLLGPMYRRLGNFSIYGETLCKPKHNVLAYAKAPVGNIVVFGAVSDRTGWVSAYEDLATVAFEIGLQSVPLLYKGHGFTGNPAAIDGLLDTDSFLGNQKIEGIIVKNYGQNIFLGGHAMPSFGKLVSDKFKERMKQPGERIKFAHGTGKFNIWLESFRTDARWEKAIQHLRDSGKLLGDPKDIGALIREVKRDVIDEESLNIKEELYKLFKEEVERKAVAGLPEYYKAKLARGEV